MLCNAAQVDDPALQARQAAVDALYDNTLIVNRKTKPPTYSVEEWNERQVCPKCKTYHVVHRFAVDRCGVYEYGIENKFCPDCGTRTTRGGVAKKRLQKSKKKEIINNDTTN